MELGLVSEEDFNKFVDPTKMIGPKARTSNLPFLRQVKLNSYLLKSHTFLKLIQKRLKSQDLI